jgi:uncharacterized protein
MKGVLTDTGILYALVDPSDQYHNRAKRELKEATKFFMSLIVPYPIALESYSLVLRKLGGRVAQRWLQELQEGFAFLSPTSSDYERAMRLSRRYPDQKLSLFDCLMSELALELSIPIWTFDAHFDIIATPVWRG